MEYFTYILIILGIMGLCVLLFRYRGPEIDLGRSSKPRLAKKDDLESPPTQKVAQAEQRTNVPAPWGWPGNHSADDSNHERSVSESLHRFVDHLISEKKTVQNSEYLLKRNESIRVLMEDRYGRPTRQAAEQSDTNPSQQEQASSIRKGNGSLVEVKTPWGW